MRMPAGGPNGRFGNRRPQRHATSLDVGSVCLDHRGPRRNYGDGLLPSQTFGPRPNLPTSDSPRAGTCPPTNAQRTVADDRGLLPGLLPCGTRGIPYRQVGHRNTLNRSGAGGAWCRRCVRSPTTIGRSMAGFGVSLRAADPVTGGSSWKSVPLRECLRVGARRRGGRSASVGAPAAGAREAIATVGLDDLPRVREPRQGRADRRSCEPGRLRDLAGGRSRIARQCREHLRLGLTWRRSRRRACAVGPPGTPYAGPRDGLLRSVRRLGGSFGGWW